MRDSEWRIVPLVMGECVEGCYKHFDKVAKKWVCCKCGT